MTGDEAIDEQRAIMDTDHYLQTHRDRLITQGFSVQTGAPFGGTAASWIVEEVDFRQADLVVMATHDRVGPDRWVHGSVAEQVVNRGGAPVMLVRSGDAASVERFNAPQPTLIVPLDGSELAEGALIPAADLAQQIGARIVLLGVVPWAGQMLAGEGAIVTYDKPEQARLEADAKTYLEECMGRAGRGGALHVVTSVRLGEPAKEIVAAAQEYSAAAVVMATHGRTGLVRSILGSVAGKVLHRNVVPVLLIRPPQLRAAEDPIIQTAPATAS